MANCLQNSFLGTLMVIEKVRPWSIEGLELRGLVNGPD